MGAPEYAPDERELPQPGRMEQGESYGFVRKRNSELFDLDVHAFGGLLCFPHCRISRPGRSFTDRIMANISDESISLPVHDGRHWLGLAALPCATAFDGSSGL